MSPASGAGPGMNGWRTHSHAAAPGGPAGLWRGRGASAGAAGPRDRRGRGEQPGPRVGRRAGGTCGEGGVTGESPSGPRGGRAGGSEPERCAGSRSWEFRWRRARGIRWRAGQGAGRARRGAIPSHQAGRAPFWSPEGGCSAVLVVPGPEGSSVRQALGTHPDAQRRGGQGGSEAVPARGRLAPCPAQASNLRPSHWASPHPQTQGPGEVEGLLTVTQRA